MFSVFHYYATKLIIVITKNLNSIESAYLALRSETSLSTSGDEKVLSLFFDCLSSSFDNSLFHFLHSPMQRTTSQDEELELLFASLSI